VALTIAAAALTVLVPVLISLGLMPWDNIVKGLTLLAGVFVILGAAGYLLAPVVLVIIGLAAALVLIGAAFLLAGAGAALFATAFAAIVVAGAAGLKLLQDMVTMFIASITPALIALAQGIVAFAGVIASGGVQFTAAILTILDSILQALIDAIPKFAQLMAELITAGLQVIIDLVPVIVQAGLDMINKLLEIIGRHENLATMADKATDIIVAFMDAIGRNIPRVVDAGLKMVTDLMNGIGDAARNNGPALGEAAGNMVTGIISGLVNGIKAAAPQFKEALLGMAKKALDGVLSFFGIHSPSTVMMWVSEQNVAGLVKGIDRYGSRAVDATEGMSSDMLNAMGKSISGLGDMVNGSMNDLTPVITPVLDLTQVQKDSSQISRLLADAKSPIRVDSAATQARSASAEYTDNQIAAMEAALDGGNHFEFTQINQSPKALSLGEIYRQTKSQISVAKGALTTVAD
jgi:hypothetical protein